MQEVVIGEDVDLVIKLKGEDDAPIDIANCQNVIAKFYQVKGVVIKTVTLFPLQFVVVDSANGILQTSFLGTDNLFALGEVYMYLQVNVNDVSYSIGYKVNKKTDIPLFSVINEAV